MVKILTTKLSQWVRHITRSPGLVFREIVNHSKWYTIYIIYSKHFFVYFFSSIKKSHIEMPPSPPHGHPQHHLLLPLHEGQVSLSLEEDEGRQQLPKSNVLHFPRVWHTVATSLTSCWSWKFSALPFLHFWCSLEYKISKMCFSASFTSATYSYILAEIKYQLWEAALS